MTPYNGSRTIFFVHSVDSHGQARLRLAHDHSLQRIVFGRSTSTLFLMSARALLALSYGRHTMSLFRTSDGTSLLGVRNGALRIGPFARARVRTLASSVITRKF